MKCPKCNIGELEEVKGFAGLMGVVECNNPKCLQRFDKHAIIADNVNKAINNFGAPEKNK